MQALSRLQNMIAALEEVEAVKAWGPDHASRAPKAYYDMRG